MALDKTNLNAWFNKQVDQYPDLELDGEKFEYAKEQSKISLENTGLNSTKTIKLTGGGVMFMEDSNTEGTKFAIPIVQSPAFMEFVMRNKENENTFTMTLLYNKSGYVVQMTTARFEDVTTGQMGDVVNLMVVGSQFTIDKTS